MHVPDQLPPSRQDVASGCCTWSSRLAYALSSGTMARTFWSKAPGRRPEPLEPARHARRNRASLHRAKSQAQAFPGAHARHRARWPSAPALSGSGGRRRERAGGDNRGTCVYSASPRPQRHARRRCLVRSRRIHAQRAAGVKPAATSCSSSAIVHDCYHSKVVQSRQAASRRQKARGATVETPDA